MVTLASKCCGELPVDDVTLASETYPEGDFGKCSGCGEYEFFTTVEESEPTVANKDKTYLTSVENLELIGTKCGFSQEIYMNFNPAIISWVSERIGITARDGVDQALAEGYFVINVANEINNDAHVKLPIEPGTGTVLNTLNTIADTIERVLMTTNQKVVVHCAMGMERSVLAVIWLMASKWRMQLHQAYNQIKKHRPIALDRLNWITM